MTTGLLWINGTTLNIHCTFWGETWGSVGCLGWAGRCSSYRSGGASGRGWQDCLGAGRDWFVWSADSKPHLLTTSSPDKSAGFPGWLGRGPTLPPSPAASWKSSRLHPAGWCNPSPFALGETDREGILKPASLFYTCTNRWLSKSH